jgi:hypothetical protein
MGARAVPMRYANAHEHLSPKRIHMHAPARRVTKKYANPYLSWIALRRSS